MTHNVRGLFGSVLIACAMLTGLPTASWAFTAPDFNRILDTGVAEGRMPLRIKVEIPNGFTVGEYCQAFLPTTQVGSEPLPVPTCVDGHAIINGYTDVFELDELDAGQELWLWAPVDMFEASAAANPEFWEPRVGAAVATTESLYAEAEAARAEILANRERLSEVTTLANDLAASVGTMEGLVAGLRNDLEALEQNGASAAAVTALRGRLDSLEQMLGGAIPGQALWEVIRGLQADTANLANRLVDAETLNRAQSEQIGGAYTQLGELQAANIELASRATALEVANATLWRWLVFGGVVTVLVIIALVVMLRNARQKTAALEARLAELEEKLANVTKPVDRREFDELKRTVNAFVSRFETAFSITSAEDIKKRFEKIEAAFNAMQEELAKRDAADPSHGLKAGDEFSRRIGDTEHQCKVLTIENGADGNPAVWVIKTPFTKPGGELQWRPNHGRKPETLFVRVDRHLKEQAKKEAANQPDGPHLAVVHQAR